MVLIPQSIPVSTNFDVTLMFRLIRNLTSINPPINGFDSLPLPRETTPGADLARIRFYRNLLVHHDSNTMANDDFNTAWSDICGALSRLGGPAIHQECQELKVKVLDQSHQGDMLEIQQSMKDIKELGKKIESSQTDNLEKFKKKVEKLQSTLPTKRSKVEIQPNVGVKRLKLSGDASTSSLLDNIKRSQFKAKPTNVKDDVEINGYKSVTNKDQFYQLHIVCDNFVVDCIIDVRLKRKCRKSVAEFQECTEEMAEWRQTQQAVHEQVNDKFLHFVKLRKSFLCQYFLNHTSCNEIENRILVDALYSSIKNDDADTAKFIGWQIARYVLKSINVPLYDIWLASLCICSGRKTTKPNSFFCSSNVTIIIMVPQLIKDTAENFEGIPIKQVAYHCEVFKEAKAISAESTKLLENDINIQCHVPGPFAEQLFNNHRRLTLVCSSEIKSKDFPTVPMFLTRACIQLYCYVKGAIPIGENHFPGSLQGIPTDVIEGFPRFCSNKLRIGDSVTNTRMKGTLGGFCRFYGREAFLTCAHAMMDWETLLSTGHKQHTQLESVHFNTGDNILNETPLCGKVVNHTFTHDNSKKVSTDAAVIELDKDISVPLDDYVNTKGNGSLQYKALGLKSRYLQDGYIQSPKELHGKNINVVCARAVSGFKDQVSPISKVEEWEMEREDIVSASTNLITRALKDLQTRVVTFVHMNAFVPQIIYEAKKEEAKSRRTVQFYNQLAVHKIPFTQGDSGACVYITDGRCAKGCLGMAIADFPGNGCIVTPMATLLEKLDLI
ncbi:uncharacterized protein [Mytilus edulis]|uniref:uncharacterized protein n=1 Tax=Mytilus edulis TaxID=6550 RepID=UPI0039F149C8